MKEKKEYLYGYHPIKEALNEGYFFKKVYFKKGRVSPKTQDLIDQLKEKKIQFFFIEKEEINYLSPSDMHQGILAELKSGTRFISNLEDFLYKQTSKSHFIVVLDGIEDPHNLGAITRSAHYFGCCLMMIESKNSAPINHTVHKISSGASLLIPFFKTEKLLKSVETLKQHHYQIIASKAKDSPANNLQSLKLSSKVCLIIGSEEKGMRPHLLRESDHFINLKGVGHFNSLNASVASGILMYLLKEKLNDR